VEVSGYNQIPPEASSVLEAFFVMKGGKMPDKGILHYIPRREYRHEIKSMKLP
jgi:hypothetical protein